MTSSKSNIILIFVILVIGILHITGIREGLYWEDDFGMYPQLAKNITERKDSQD